MPDRWFLTGFQDWACKESYHLIVTTDAPCHLWLNHSLNQPQKHPRTRVLRGLNVEGDVYYCFTAYEGVEQNEAGDTTSHSFDVAPWGENLTRYFYLYGTVAGLDSPSQSPIFGRQVIKDTKYYLTQVNHAWNEMDRYEGGTRTCPSYCPLFFNVGRGQTAARKEGGGFVFNDFQIPFCAEILNAYLELTSYSSNSVSPVHCQISAEGTITPDDWYGAGTVEVFTRWATRIGIVNWDNLTAWIVGQSYYSPDIKTTIDAVINQAGWKPGLAVSLFWDDYAQRTPWNARRKRFAVTYTTDILTSPKLHVYYNHWQVKEIPVF